MVIHVPVAEVVALQVNPVVLRFVEAVEVDAADWCIAREEAEFDNIKTKDFPFFSKKAEYTDDSILTFATAKWILEGASLSLE